MRGEMKREKRRDRYNCRQEDTLVHLLQQPHKFRPLKLPWHDPMLLYVDREQSCHAYPPGEVVSHRTFSD